MRKFMFNIRALVKLYTAKQPSFSTIALDICFVNILL